MDGNLWQARNIVQLLDESTADFRQVSHVFQQCGKLSCLVQPFQRSKVVHSKNGCLVVCSCKPSCRAKAARKVELMSLKHGLQGSHNPPQGI